MLKIVNHFGLSGGKDSTALLGWAIHESGYPKESIYPSFCDTENEYDEVYQQIKDLDKYCVAHGVRPIRILRAIDHRWAVNQHPLFLALSIWKGRFPSPKVRFCTEKLKIEPTLHYLEELWVQGYEVVAHSGVRASESIERSVMTEWGEQFFCKVRRPLLTLSLADIWGIHKKYKLPINPLYFTGRKRVGCRLCVMSNKRDVRLTVKDRPWVILLYRAWEKIVGKYRSERGSKCQVSSFFHRKTVPISQRTSWINTKGGERMAVCTIDDVARWSQTLHGGSQAGFGFMFEEEDFNADDAGAPCQSGYCE